MSLTLRDYEKHMRPEFENGQILLEAFARIIARKKHAIMGCERVAH